MSDPGTRYADARLIEIENRLRSVYNAAAREIVEQMNAGNERFRAADAVRRALVENGKMTEADYQSWVRRQMMTDKIWKDKLNSAAIVLLEANEQAARIVDGERRAVFGENATWQAYQLEHDAGLNLSFAVYDSATVTRLISEQPNLLPPRVINGERDKAWNRGKMSAIIARSIIAGLSVPEIAKAIGEETAVANEKAAVRYARTAMTAAQNAGRMEVLHEAQEMGIDVRKVWLATLDERTREAHTLLDGQEQKVDDPFDSILGPIMYPGDPSADDENVWNCRCTLTYEYKEYPQQNAMRYDQLNGVNIEDMTYSEWIEAKGGR